MICLYNEQLAQFMRLKCALTVRNDWNKTGTQHDVRFMTGSLVHIKLQYSLKQIFNLTIGLFF
ncbi:hypothetical protein BLOT_008772 [Blomia tropicalis]|nr:hypothetical protein BLOT_008772 [Blomia tropicalis]